MKMPNALSGDGLRIKSVRGTLVTGLGMFGNNALRLAGNLVLTRILFPEAFGIMALVQVFMTGIKMFSDIGINGSIIQNARGDDPVFLDTAWVFQIIRGVLIWLLVWLSAGPVAGFYGQPILADILPVVALTLIIRGFSSTKLATARRHINLGRMTALELGAQGLGIATMILLALVLESVWALALGMLVPSLFLTTVSHVLMPGHNNRFRFEWSAARELFGFGKYIFIATASTFLMSQADRAVLGRFVEIDTLAFYNIAYALGALPLVLMASLSRSIFLPLYVQRPPGASAENYRNIARARFLVLGGLVAASLLLALIGLPFIEFAYDARYVTAGPLVALVALALIPSMVMGNYEMVLLAAGHSGRYALLMLLMALIRTGLLLVCIQVYGLVGVIYALFVSSFINYVPLVLFVRPYGSWMPKQDAFFFVLALLGTVLVLWLTPEARNLLSLNLPYFNV